MKKLLPPIVLIFLAPAIAELLSGSAPPVEFFNPFVFLLLTTLYGSGALLVRELKHRWHKGWASLFILGAAYGILEDGLMTKSYFDPAWVDIGILGSHGRWAGVNWVWGLDLTLFHAVVSIAIPILLVELMFPQRRGELWVGKWGLTGLSALLAADVAFGYFFLNSYSPPLIPYILAVAAVVALVLLAWRLPHPIFSPKKVHVRHPLWFLAHGLYWSNSVLPGILGAAEHQPSPLGDHVHRRRAGGAGCLDSNADVRERVSMVWGASTGACRWPAEHVYPVGTNPGIRCKSHQQHGRHDIGGSGSASVSHLDVVASKGQPSEAGQTQASARDR